MRIISFWIKYQNVVLINFGSSDRTGEYPPTDAAVSCPDEVEVHGAQSSACAFGWWQLRLLILRQRKHAQQP